MAKWKTRHTFTLMCFLGFASNYCMRVSLSVVIIAMVKTDSKSSMEIGDECPGITKINETTEQLGGYFTWSQTDQSLVLGSFFYGYVASQLFGGFMIKKFGGKWVFGVGTLIEAILALCSPMVAKYGTGAYVTLRILQGISEGMNLPAFTALATNWIPIQEKSFLFAVCLAGGEAGTVLCLTISGILAANYGWECTFYVWGTCGVVWSMFWFFLVYDTPNDHPRISDDEQTFVNSNVHKAYNLGKLPPAPILKILTSGPVLANIFTALGQNYGFYTILKMTPTYLNNIQHISIRNNGFLSALPHLCLWWFSMPWGWFADYLIRSGKSSLPAVRKLSNTVGMLGPSLGLLCLAFAGCDNNLTVVSLCFSCALYGALYSGYQATYGELSPNYAGTVAGIVSAIGNSMGFISPMIVAAFVDNNQTIGAWKNVYLLGSAMFLIFAIVWSIFGSSEVQWWDSYWENNEKMEYKRCLIENETNDDDVSEKDFASH